MQSHFYITFMEKEQNIYARRKEDVLTISRLKNGTQEEKEVSLGGMLAN